MNKALIITNKKMCDLYGKQIEHDLNQIAEVAITNINTYQQMLQHLNQIDYIIVINSEDDEVISCMQYLQDINQPYICIKTKENSKNYHSLEEHIVILENNQDYYKCLKLMIKEVKNEIDDELQINEAKQIVDTIIKKYREEQNLMMYLLYRRYRLELDYRLLWLKDYPITKLKALYILYDQLHEDIEYELNIFKKSHMLFLKRKTKLAYELYLKEPTKYHYECLMGAVFNLYDHEDQSQKEIKLQYLSYLLTLTKNNSQQDYLYFKKMYDTYK